jgi:hypothetical protein
MNTTLNFDNFKCYMKRILLIFGLCSLVTLSLRAQEESDPAIKDPHAAEKIQNLRIAYISEKLGLTPEQAEKFWPVYREFVQQRNALRKEWKTAQRAVGPGNTDPKKQQELVDLGLQIKQKELDLEKDASGRLLKVINAQQYLNLKKAEQDFRAMIINQLQQRRLMQQRKEIFRDDNQRLRQKVN